MQASSAINEKQREAVHSPARSLLILAGPGSGKTLVLTRRIQQILSPRPTCQISDEAAGRMIHGTGFVVASAKEVDRVTTTAGCVLALTFTNRAAREMKDRVLSLVEEDRMRGSRLCTFHSLCAYLLRKFGAQQFEIASDRERTQAMASALKKVYDEDECSAGLRQQIRQRIDRWKGSGKLPEQVLQEIQSPHARRATDRTKAGMVYKHYQDALSARSFVDFGDLTLQCVRMLETDAGVRAAVQRRWRHVLVDEFQDTSVLQWKLLLLLVGPSLSTSGGARSHASSPTGRSSITVVGDPNQCIYTWRLASSKNTKRFIRQFPDAAIVHLKVSYRSTPRVLRAANAVLIHGCSKTRTGDTQVSATGGHADSKETEGIAAFSGAPPKAHRTKLGIKMLGISSSSEARPLPSLEQLQRLQFEPLESSRPDISGPQVIVMLFSTAEDEAAAVAGLAAKQQSMRAAGASRVKQGTGVEKIDQFHATSTFSSSRSVLQEQKSNAGRFKERKSSPTEPVDSNTAQVSGTPTDRVDSSSTNVPGVTMQDHHMGRSGHNQSQKPDSIAVLGRFHSIISPIEKVLRQSGSNFTRIGVAKALDRPDTNAAIAMVRLIAGPLSTDSAVQCLATAAAYPPRGLGVGTLNLILSKGVLRSSDSDSQAARQAPEQEPESESDIPSSVHVIDACNSVVSGQQVIKGIGKQKLGILAAFIDGVRAVRNALSDAALVDALQSTGPQATAEKICTVLFSATGILEAAGVEEQWIALAPAADGCLVASTSRAASATAAGDACDFNGSASRSSAPSGGTEKLGGNEELARAAPDPETIGTFSCFLGVVQSALEDWSEERRLDSDSEGADERKDAMVSFAHFFSRRLVLLGGADLAVKPPSDGEQAGCSITLSTIHASKGLEYDTVIVPGLVEGVLPSLRREQAADSSSSSSDEEADSNVIDDLQGASAPHDGDASGSDSGKSSASSSKRRLVDGLAEERRLLYVAMTRARRNLILTHYEKTRRWNRWHPSPPSRFLKALKELTASAVGTDALMADVVFRDCRRPAIRPQPSGQYQNHQDGVATAAAGATRQLRAVVDSQRRSGQRLGQGDFRAQISDLPIPALVQAIDPKPRPRLLATVGDKHRGLAPGAYPGVHVGLNRAINPDNTASLGGGAGPLHSLGGGAGPLPSLGGGAGPLPSLGGGAGPLPSLGGGAGPLPSLGGSDSEHKPEIAGQLNHGLHGKQTVIISGANQKRPRGHGSSFRVPRTHQVMDEAQVGKRPKIGE